MKREELMINDIVFDYTNSPVKVCAVGQDIVVKNSFGIGSLEPKELSPIPLTEEILVKNGFVYREEEETCATDAFHHWQLDGHSFALNSTQYFRKEKKDDMSRFDVAGIAIRYVHQLQHLLRLAGIDKEIEL